MLYEIEQLNSRNNKSRIMAGDCWKWPKAGRTDADHLDSTIPEHNFVINYNIQNTQAIESNSVREAGCIHTAQGLEFDYVCVIIGNDLCDEDGQVITDHTKCTKTD